VTVYLVGAGPGDPGLLTRRGAALLARAEVVVHDRLVDRSLLSLAPPGAELVDVGKRSAEPGAGDDRSGPPRQAQINQLLVEHGRHGRAVVRLKGGDPFLFGRGGEEAEALAAAGVPYEVVPGVTSAVAVPGAAGVPVTHRGLSTSVTVVTGHVGDPTAPGGVDWASLARAGGTLVVLMGMQNRAEIAARLIEGGRAPGTPVAVVEWGTTAAQRTVRATLAELAAVDLGSPSVIVVGPVAGLDFGGGSGGTSAALAGRTVVVTRPRDQATGLVDELTAAGARVLLVPVTEQVDPEDGGQALADAAKRASTYDWLAFTSANAVRRFVPLLRDGRDLGRARLAAVGRATAGALAGYHLTADLVPSRAEAAALADALGEAPPSGRVLFPAAAGARETLPEVLRERGWQVDQVSAYRTVVAPAPPPPVWAELAGADAITFSAPSAVAAYVGLRDAGGRAAPVPPVVACTGPVTTAAARGAGLTGVVEAAGPGERALADALGSGLGAEPPLG
jgi:uroporphyrinogen III methyltransferase/synthase